MKISIASVGNTLESNIDNSFGRCAFFIIYDTTTKSIEFLPNPNKDLEEGAGKACVQLIKKKEVSKIVSGEFGIKIKPLLDSLKIQMIVVKNPDKTIKDIIDMIDQLNIQPSIELKG